MEEGAIVLISLPQDPSGKIRPALVLKRLPQFDDYLICAITSQQHQYIPGFDLQLTESHSAFTASGLKKSSVIKIFKLAVMKKDQISGAIGFLPSDLHAQLLQNLVTYLSKQ